MFGPFRRRPRLHVVGADNAARVPVDWFLRAFVVGGILVAAALGWLVTHAR